MLRMRWAVPLQQTDCAFSASLGPGARSPERATRPGQPTARPASLSGITARRITEHDLGFLRRLYASTRAEELAATRWPLEAQQQFLAQQFELQHRHYQVHFADAEFLLLLRQEQPIGRLYWHAQAGQATLVEISLLPAHRGQGLGSGLLAVLAAQADLEGQSIDLHVDPTGPARRLYERFGFIPVAARGDRLQMTRRPRTREPAAGRPWLLADLRCDLHAR